MIEGVLDEIRNLVLNIEPAGVGTAVEVISDTPSTAFTTVSSGSTGNAFGSYAEVISSTSKEYLLDSICAYTSDSNVSYDNVQVLRIATGASGSETVIATVLLSVSMYGDVKTINFLSPRSNVVIPSGSRIAIAIADVYTASNDYSVSLQFSV